MLGLKKLIKRIVPLSWIILAKRCFYYGTKYKCVLCGASLRKQLPQGYGFPVLEKLQVVGGMWTPDDMCPVCFANDRSRLIYLYLKEHTKVLDGDMRVLHFAPEPGLSIYLEKSIGRTGNYIATDLDYDRYRHLKNFKLADITTLPFEDDSFDFVICSHVLEHVPDDKTALSEIKRVMKPGSSAIIQVPISMTLEKTDFDPTIVERAERIERFGQADHVRLYARDFWALLEGAGFQVNLYTAFDDDPERAGAWNLNPHEKLPIVSKPEPPMINPTQRY